MSALSPDAVASLLNPYVGATPVPPIIYDQLNDYLELILKWNSRINLTAIRDPEQIVRRHFGEGLFAGLHLDYGASSSCSCDSLLDLGSGAGFPGIPIQLLYPDLPVTLAESRTRKAAFLREVIRTLGLRTEVWAGRAEDLPPDRRFHTVALRAVDDMRSAVAEAGRRATHRILLLASGMGDYGKLPAAFRLQEPIPMPNSQSSVLQIAERLPG